MLDGLRGYVSLVSGLTEATAARAREVATALLAQGGVQGVPAGASAMATQITGLAEDLLVTARDNRGMLMEVVRAEAERAVSSIGLVTTAEAESLRTRIADLERELAAERARAVPDATRAPTSSAAPRPARTRKSTRPAQRAATKPAAGKTAAGKTAKAAGTSAAGKTVGKTAAGKTAPTKASRAASKAPAGPTRVGAWTTITPASTTTPPGAGAGD